MTRQTRSIGIDRSNRKSHRAGPAVKRLAVLSAAAMSLARIAPAMGQLYWDINGPTPGAGGATPTGTWDNSTTNWNIAADGSGAVTSWTANSSAVFSAGADAIGNFGVTLSGVQSTTGLTVEEGNVTFDGSALNLTGTASLTVGSGLTTQFNNAIGGFVGLNKGGAGTLLLAGNNTLSGPVTINAGTLNL